MFTRLFLFIFKLVKWSFCGHLWSRCYQNQVESACDLWPNQELKIHSNALSYFGREISSCPLSKEPKRKNSVHSMPIKKMRRNRLFKDTGKGSRFAKHAHFTRVCHQHWIGDIGKNNGTTGNVSTHFTHMGITRPNLNKGDHKVLKRKATPQPEGGKGELLKKETPDIQE